MALSFVQLANIFTNDALPGSRYSLHCSPEKRYLPHVPPNHWEGLTNEAVLKPRIKVSFFRQELKIV